MISFPNCKINLGLRVVAKRTDGFHTIETIFYPVPWTDILEVVMNEDTNASTAFKSTGIRVYGPKEKNLCLKAYQLLSEKHNLPPVKMHLHKVIPIGAGLGGGSSDAANTLISLNKLFRLNLSEEELEDYASEIGSDCPFFIRNKAMYATEKGNVMEPVNLKLKNIYIVVVKPRVHISTAEAYAGISPAKKNNSLKDLIRLPIEDWKDQIANDFEKTIFESHPGIRNIKNKLYKFGAVYASMSGSGSAVYGLFKEEKNLRAYFRSCTVWQGKLS
ncbi:MAG TPA: 4-(cytidine 5'-diphospho)-2-C-methyl-D-erythritol kinase [Bacteroidia bacterium]|nr:4-(cytidine 5'-diphospho)-2-C-methyl-D-erythritol kinase [Bacteroidia bacterium]